MFGQASTSHDASVGHLGGPCHPRSASERAFWGGDCFPSGGGCQAPLALGSVDAMVDTAAVRCVGCLTLLAVGCAGGVEGEPTGASRQPIIYGSDDRVEVLDYESPRLSALVRRRVGALIPSYSILPKADGYQLVGPTLAEIGICPDERHADQLAIAGCTALRVTDDRIVTAGHCFTSGWLTDAFFVTGYWLGGDYPTIAVRDVHEVDEVLLHVDGDLGASPSSDYAVARLARPVAADGVEIEFASGLPATGDAVVVAGTSEGLPLKMDAGAVVIRSLGKSAFELTSDTFAGGSGSPVFTPEGLLLGMVVGGGSDYVLDERRDCLVPRVVEAEPETAEIAVAAAVLESAVTREGRLASESCSFSAVRASSGGFRWLGIALTALAIARRSGTRRARSYRR